MVSLEIVGAPGGALGNNPIVLERDITICRIQESDRKSPG